jgi:hypothetical protein
VVSNSKQERAISNLPIVRILAVDDCADWRRCVLDRLRTNSNLEVVGVASDGVEAVLKAQQLSTGHDLHGKEFVNPKLVDHMCNTPCLLT